MTIINIATTKGKNITGIRVNKLFNELTYKDILYIAYRLKINTDVNGWCDVTNEWTKETKYIELS